MSAQVHLLYTQYQAGLQHVSIKSANEKAKRAAQLLPAVCLHEPKAVQKRASAVSVGPGPRPDLSRQALHWWGHKVAKGTSSEVLPAASTQQVPRPGPLWVHQGSPL